MNDSSFEYLYNKYLNQIIRYIIVYHDIDENYASDIAQDVFSVLWKKWNKLRDKDEKIIVSWIYETAKRLSKAYHRIMKRMPIYTYLDVETLSDDEYSATCINLMYFDELESNYERYQKYLSEIKKHLAGRELLMFEMIVEKGLDQKTVAGKLGISDVNFRVSWFRLRKKLDPIVKKYTL